MAASIVGAARTPSDGSDATGASLALTIPAGTAVDDYAALIIELWDSTATNPTLTYPSGFTQIVNYVSTTDGFQKFKVAIKKLTAADSGTYSVSGFASHFRQGHCAILRGIDTTTALDVAVNLAQNASGTALPANSITTVTAGCLLMHVIANENSCTGTPSTGYTEQADSNYTKTNTKIQSSAGTDTPAGGSFSASTLKLGALIAFRPASSGATTHVLAATGAGTATGSADLSLKLTAATSGSGISAGTAAVALLQAVTASGAGTATGSAGLSFRLLGAGTGASSSGGTATLVLRLPLAATGAAAVSGSAALTSRLAVAASGASATGGSADLAITGTGPTTHALTASGSGSATGTAALRLAGSLSATGAATSQGTAVLAARNAMAAVGGTVSVGSAYLTALWMLTASGSGTSGGVANLVVVGALPPITPRPFTGSTPHPVGIPSKTLRPDAGITLRP